MGLILLESFASQTLDEFWTFSGVSPQMLDGPAGKEIHPASLASLTFRADLLDTPTNDVVVCFALRCFRDDTQAAFEVTVQSGGAEQFALDMTAGSLVRHYKLGASRNLPAQQLQHFALKVSAQTGTSGSASLHVWDGSAWEQLWALTGVDTALTGSPGVDGLQVSLYNQQRMSNLSVWSGTALPAEPVFCFPQSVAVDLGPNAWQPSDAGLLHALHLDDDVNELTARASALTERYGFDVPYTVGTGAAIFGLMLRSLSRRAAAAAQPFHLAVWSGAVKAASATITPASTNRRPNVHVVEQDPEAAAAWVESTLALAEVGVVSE